MDGSQLAGEASTVGYKRSVVDMTNNRYIFTHSTNSSTNGASEGSICGQSTDRVHKLVVVVVVVGNIL